MAYGLYGQPSVFNAPNFIFDRIADGNKDKSIVWEDLISPEDGGNEKIPDDGVFQGRYCLFLKDNDKHNGSILMKTAKGWYLEIGTTRTKEYSLQVDEDGVAYLEGFAETVSGTRLDIRNITDEEIDQAVYDAKNGN